MYRVYAPGRLAIVVKVGLLAATSICVWPVAAIAAPTQQHNQLQSFDVAASNPTFTTIARRPGAHTRYMLTLPQRPSIKTH